MKKLSVITNCSVESNLNFDRFAAQFRDFLEKISSSDESTQLTYGVRAVNFTFFLLSRCRRADSTYASITH